MTHKNGQLPFLSFSRTFVLNLYGKIGNDSTQMVIFDSEIYQTYKSNETTSPRHLPIHIYMGSDNGLPRTDIPKVHVRPIRYQPGGTGKLPLAGRYLNGIFDRKPFL